MADTVSLESIPHRDPFVLVDEVVEVSDQKIVTRRFVDPEMDVLRGHYPEKPILPGVFICESCFQSSALLMAHRLGEVSTRSGVPVLTRIQDARFKNMVVPGQTLDIEVTLDDELDGACYFTGRVTVEGRPVLRVVFVTMMAES
ncbi:MAG: 3-hydroxyacyl-ACP dehydratase FabZ family protein [Planctomycetota bacterium]|jgi:3-hydroxyacyl-[acyl-carrier-protein] dehydratase